MRRAAERLGRTLYWLAWPAYLVYFRLSERTRVLLVAGDEVLLLKGWVSNGKWNLAGGGLHRGEPPLAGAVREIREETGLKLAPGQLTCLGKELFRDRGVTFVYHVFIAKVSKAQQLKRQRHEIAAIQWTPVQELDARSVSQEVIACVAAARSKGLLQ